MNFAKYLIIYIFVLILKYTIIYWKEYELYQYAKHYESEKEK